MLLVFTAYLYHVSGLLDLTDIGLRIYEPVRRYVSSGSTCAGANFS